VITQSLEDYLENNSDVPLGDGSLRM